MTLLFAHLQRTGGNTIKQLLQANYGSQGVVGGTSMPISTYVQRMADRRIFAIEGILKFGAHEYLLKDSDFEYISFVRDPISRWISYYNFCKVHKNAGLHKFALSCSLDEFIQSPKRPRNVASRVFCGYSDEPSEALLIQNFPKFSFVGMQDEFLTGAFLLSKHLGLKFPFPGHVGRLSSKPAVKLDRKSIDILHQEDSLDFKLQSMAKSRLFNEIESLEQDEKSALAAYKSLYSTVFSEDRNSEVLRNVLENGHPADRSLSNLANSLKRDSDLSTKEHNDFTAVCDYFAAIKPFKPEGKLAVGKKYEEAPRERRNEVLYRKEGRLLDGRHFNLTIEGLFRDLPDRAVFVEDHFNGLNGKRETIAAQSNRVYQSEDGGETWSAVRCADIKGPIVRCFTLASGKRLLQTSRPYGLYLAEQNFESASAVNSNAEMNWHGSWSVDQASTGTICFGEYGDYDPFVRIVRSVDGGKTWHDSLVIENVPGEAATIRHFHFVQADPYISGRWYAGSGDRNTECRFWISDDDAESWRELGDPNIIGSHPFQYLTEPRRIYRLVALSIDADYIYWPTDDLMQQDEPGFFRMSKTEPFEVEYLCSLGNQELRSAVQTDEGDLICISQLNKRNKGVEVFLVNRAGQPSKIAELPRSAEGISAFCKSISSKRAGSSVFFSYSGGPVLDERPRLMRWTLNFS